MIIHLRRSLASFSRQPSNDDEPLPGGANRSENMCFFDDDASCKARGERLATDVARSSPFTPLCAVALRELSWRSLSCALSVVIARAQHRSASADSPSCSKRGRRVSEASQHVHNWRYALKRCLRCVRAATIKTGNYSKYIALCLVSTMCVLRCMGACYAQSWRESWHLAYTATWY